MTPACDQCRFFHLRNDPESESKSPIDGECRRCPPQVGRPMSEDTRRTDYRLGVFPRVMIFDWCGDFETRPANSDVPYPVPNPPVLGQPNPLRLGGPNTSLKDSP